MPWSKSTKYIGSCKLHNAIESQIFESQSFHRQIVIQNFKSQLANTFFGTFLMFLARYNSLHRIRYLVSYNPTLESTFLIYQIEGWTVDQPLTNS